MMYEKSVDLLNRAVRDELSAIHQYMYFHFHCEQRGYDLLSALFKNTAIDEMRHIERISERILFLKGDVGLKASEEVRQIHDVKEMLKLACQMEEQSMKDYNLWAMECASNADAISNKLFEDLIADEERHYDQYDIELENLKKFGENYLALQSIEHSKNTAMGTTQA